MADISKITIPNPQAGEAGQPATLTFDIKDAVARAAIDAGFEFHIATQASDTPEGVKWDKAGTLITGTLPAYDSTTHQPQKGFYLVPSNVSGESGAKDVYDEYIVAKIGNAGTAADYAWERLGNTEIDFDNLAQYLDTTVSAPTDKVLGKDTTFTASSSGVTFTGGSSDTFVKSYPGTSSKLETTSIKGVGNDVTFTSIDANTSVTATNTVFGTATTASKIVTESKTATNLVLGTATTASKATAGTNIVVAKKAASATNVSYIGNSSTSSVLENATVSGETLILGAVSVSQGSVTGTNGTETITPYTFADVTVPVVTSNNSVTVASVKTNTDVTVPVVSSNTSVTATNTTTKSTTAATSAANATTVATGSLKANDTAGATVMTGLGNATTASAVTGIGTGTAGAQTITVGTNDQVDAVTSVGVTIINKPKA